MAGPRGYATKRPDVVKDPFDDSDNRYVNRAKSAKRKGRINLRAVADVLAERGYDPTHEIINILETRSLPKDVEVRVWSNLLEYTQPKKKAVEITGKDGGPIRLEQVSDAELLKIAMGGKDTAEDVQYVEVEDTRPRNAFGQLIQKSEVMQAIADDDDGDDSTGDGLIPELQ